MFACKVAGWCMVFHIYVPCMRIYLFYFKSNPTNHINQIMNQIWFLPDLNFVHLANKSERPKLDLLIFKHYSKIWTKAFSPYVQNFPCNHVLASNPLRNHSCIARKLTHKHVLSKLEQILQLQICLRNQLCSVKRDNLACIHTLNSLDSFNKTDFFSGCLHEISFWAKWNFFNLVWDHSFST